MRGIRHDLLFFFQNNNSLTTIITHCPTGDVVNPSRGNLKVKINRQCFAGDAEEKTATQCFAGDVKEKTATYRILSSGYTVNKRI